MSIFLRQLLIISFWAALLFFSLRFYYGDVVRYFTGDISPRQAAEKWWLVAHFIGAGCTLILGPLQFWPWFRNRFRKWHRLAGKIFIGGSILAAITVFYLLSNYTLPGSIPSLGMLAVIWLFVTIAAYWFATKKNFKLHKQFMIRSYVCALAFLFIRLLPDINEWTGIFNFIEEGPTRMRSTVFEWICWVYPLVITEFLLVWWPSIRKYRKTSTAR
jgi:uncharacterized membrane protein